jgi:hypothetical protein
LERQQGVRVWKFMRQREAVPVAVWADGLGRGRLVLQQSTQPAVHDGGIGVLRWRRCKGPQRCLHLVAREEQRVDGVIFSEFGAGFLERLHGR